MNKIETSKKCNDASVVVAKLYGVTPDYVRKVARGDRKNKSILECYHQYKLGKTSLIKALEKTTKVL